MRRVRSLAWSVVCLALIGAALLCAASVASANPVQLGRTTIEKEGGCQCIIAQYATAPSLTTPYAITGDGVITSSLFTIGQTALNPGEEWLWAAGYRRSGPTGLTEVNRGEKHDIGGIDPTSTEEKLLQFPERFPVKAGEVLGATYHTSGFIGATPRGIETTSTADQVGILFNQEPPFGMPFEASTASKFQANVEAVLEPDADGDGYGDDSQDLCPGSPIAVSACTGTLFGSDLQGQRSPPPACGGSGCMVVQTQLGGSSTAAAEAGVVVRWRVLNGGPGSYRLRVVRFESGSSGGGNFAYRVLRSSSSEAIASRSNSAFSKISSFPTRLPIPAGAYVALGMNGATVGFQASGGAATYVPTNEPANDGVVGTGPSKNGAMLYDADVEPDADGDGYGDVTQDSCPSVATIHEGPCPSPPASGGGAGASSTPPPGTPPKGGSKKPSISGLAVKPKSFRAKPLGPASGRGAWGTKVSFSLSAKATVALAIEARQGRRFKTVTTLKKKLAAGEHSIALSGQYRRAGKLADLDPGAYRLSVSAGGSPPARASFAVLPPA